MTYQNRSVRRNSGKRLRSRTRGRSQRRLNQQNTFLAGGMRIYNGGAGVWRCPDESPTYCHTWEAKKRCTNACQHGGPKIFLTFF